ncbi:DUF2520 domain-containing protein [Rhodocaloribacter litoris]|uniref:Rossmann-like and DUF2520 domain-containing protein n=1 Tax=Rhodocaloribacter litoris TaxID=2558931 RepID=UPI00142204CE|nr:Rossmann-like and DUF2520 domain-containing protein [Rhodocaloribacter litoris]QXD14002.1 DUF2520 domain-containing protein [Rhodocaloribacter litoris]GIV60811.1 MAG: NADP oxidoreductase [Rhodothermaceae bacterium]
MTQHDHATNASPRFALIGAGGLGTALGLRLAACGYTVRAVVSRSGVSARRLAARVGAVATPLDDLPGDVEVVLCCVPDDALAPLVEALSRLPRDWAGTVVAHTSGTRSSEALAPLARRGALTLRFHPLQSFPPGSPPERFDGIYVGLEGRPAARAFGERLATGLGARPVTIPAGAGPRYHLAATLASNFLVTLMALAAEVLAGAGFDRPTARAMLQPLVEGTWRNLADRLPEEALTGPVARGDRETVRRHLQALHQDLPHLLPVYAALTGETVRVAVRSGRLNPEDARSLLDLLHAALDPPGDPLLDP